MLKHSRVARHAYASRIDKMGFSKYIKIVISSHILLDSTEQKVKARESDSLQHSQSRGFVAAMAYERLPMT